jgi:hypothetical protein
MKGGFFFLSCFRFRFRSCFCLFSSLRGELDTRGVYMDLVILKRNMWGLFLSLLFCFVNAKEFYYNNEN